MIFVKFAVEDVNVKQTNLLHAMVITATILERNSQAL